MLAQKILKYYKRTAWFGKIHKSATIIKKHLILFAEIRHLQIFLLLFYLKIHN